jgi:hypothetical protein
VTAIPRVDHVLIALPDLGTSVRVFEHAYGLTSVEGGRHTGWGTANRIVPLGDAYLEIVAVVEPSEASQNPFGRWVAGAPAGEPFGWCVRVETLDALSSRFGLDVGAGSRPTAEGGFLQWRLAGLENAIAAPPWPFLIEWTRGSAYPGGLAADHPAGSVRLAGVTVGGASEPLGSWLREWIPEAVMPATSPHLTVALSTASGDVVLGRRSD